MDPNNGKLYPSLSDAKKAGVKDPVEIFGSKKSVKKVSDSLQKKARQKASRKNQKSSRKANRNINR